MVTRVQNDIVDRLAAIPDVTAVGFAAAVPLDGIDADWNQLQVEGKDYDEAKPQMWLYDYVSPGYFNAMGIRLVAGRDFNWTDNYSLRHKLIVSEAFAREAWGSAANAIGKHARQSNRNPWDEVIGVVEDVHQHGVDAKAPMIIYWPVLMYIPYLPQPTIGAQRNVTFAIRSRRAGSEGFLSQVRQAVSSVNPNLPVAGPRTMQDVYVQSLARQSFTLVMLAIAGSMALALGSHRHLWRNFLRYFTAHARDWNSHGAGGAKTRGQMDVCPVGFDPHRCRYWHWPRDCSGARAVYEDAAVRDSSHRSRDVHCGSRCPGYGCGCGKLFTGCACCCDQCS